MPMSRKTAATNADMINPRTMRLLNLSQFEVLTIIVSCQHARPCRLTRSPTRCRRLMPLQEDVILPAAHAQQDFAQQRDVVPVLGIDRDLGGGAKRDLITRDVIG